jgi:alkanesulfonate monooxygenase SsuD/methylene tetrahydromethanopterin reductase-like flavin-dependent oxidoreductase (luciferase family)
MKFQAPRPGYLSSIPAHERALLDHVLACTAIGSPAKVREQMEAFLARTKADELMITSQVFDHAARLRSFEIAASVRS